LRDGTQDAADSFAAHAEDQGKTGDAEGENRQYERHVTLVGGGQSYVPLSLGSQVKNRMTFSFRR
jgi:hypothetical protein